MKLPAELLYSCFPNYQPRCKLASGRSSDKDSSGGLRLKNLFSLGPLAAVLGTGYLANKGLENLSNLNAPGSFRNQLEKGILSQHNQVQAQQLQQLNDRLTSANKGIRNRNLALGGALALGLAPLLVNKLTQD